jgi:hypothetical protein
VDGATINLVGVGKSLNVRANMDAAVDYVKFFFDGAEVRTENVEPYALGGDFDEDYEDFSGLTEIGDHTIEAVAYASETQLGSWSISFTVESETYRTTFFTNAGPGEDTSVVGGNLRTYELENPISGTGSFDESLFQSHRYGDSFTYSIYGFAPDSTNAIALGFAEIWQPNCDAGAGARVMNIEVNGNSLVTGLDVLAHAACNVAHVETFRALATPQGAIVLEFESVVEKAFVSFIQIETLG